MFLISNLILIRRNWLITITRVKGSEKIMEFINSIVALPKENEHQLLFHCKYKWLSIILINYGYFIIIRIFDGG